MKIDYRALVEGALGTGRRQRSEVRHGSEKTSYVCARCRGSLANMPFVVCAERAGENTATITRVCAHCDDLPQMTTEVTT